MVNLAAWAWEQRRTYFDNAGMAREYRTQLRGIKAPLFLTAYIGLLVAMACLFYVGSTMFGSQTISSVQQQLGFFYNVVVGMLEVLIALVAPVLAASSIVGEYQRQSIDLLFSSPVGPKYFLVGKLMASYRYVLLLLAISLPVPAMCVVLGGATWKDVLSTYMLVSLHGLIYMAISIPIAVMTAKAVPAVLWSYLGGLAYFIVSMVLTIPAMVSGVMTGATAPITMGLSPIASAESGRLLTDVFGAKLPLWMPTAVIVLVFVRLMVLGAGAAITQAGSKECFNLRLSGLLLAFLVPLLVGVAVRGGFGSSVATSKDLASIVWYFSFVLVIVLPHLSNWAGTGGAKSLPNGWWKPKFFLRGTPASGLPYLLSLLTALALGGMVGLGTLSAVSGESLVYLAGVFGTWAFLWSLGWAASAMVWRGGVESSRRLHVLLMFVIIVIPGVALSIIEAALKSQGSTLPTGWSERLFLFSFVTNDMNEAWYKIVIILVLALAIGFLAERKRKDAAESMRKFA